MDTFTQEGHDWVKIIQDFPERFKIVIDNDSAWIESISDDPGCVYTFNSYGYEFIHALLKEMENL